MTFAFEKIFITEWLGNYQCGHQSFDWMDLCCHVLVGSPIHIVNLAWFFPTVFSFLLWSKGFRAVDNPKYPCLFVGFRFFCSIQRRQKESNWMELYYQPHKISFDSLLDMVHHHGYFQCAAKHELHTSPITPSLPHRSGSRSILFCPIVDYFLSFIPHIYPTGQLELEIIPVNHRFAANSYKTGRLSNYTWYSHPAYPAIFILKFRMVFHRSYLLVFIWDGDRYLPFWNQGILF